MEHVPAEWKFFPDRIAREATAAAAVVAEPAEPFVRWPCLCVCVFVFVSAQRGLGAAYADMHTRAVCIANVFEL